MTLKIHRSKARRFNCPINTGPRPVFGKRQSEDCVPGVRPSRAQQHLRAKVAENAKALRQSSTAAPDTGALRGHCATNFRTCSKKRRLNWVTAWLAAFLWLLAWQKAEAQLAPAEDFFNGGAQLYISNNVPAALEKVELGLKTYPNDEKLKKLEQLLKQQQQQQQQQQNQQNQQQQQKQDQQKNQQQNQQSSQQNQQDQRKQDEQKQSQAEQKKEEQKKQQEQQQSAAQKKEGEKQDKQEAKAQPVKEGQLTAEEAKRLLDAQKGDEQLLQWKPENKPRNPLRPVKDW